MKKVLPFGVLLLLLLNAQAQLSLPNVGFENWTNGNPDAWFTNNVVGTATPVTQSADAYSGSYALRGDVIMFNSNRISPNIGTPASTPFAVSQQYNTFNFYYKLHKVSANDGLIIALTISDSTDLPIATASYKLAVEATTYTPVSIPIFWFGSTPPHHMNLVMSLEDTTGAGGTIGSYFLMDNVSLGGFVTGINQTAAASNAVRVFPNPGTAQGWNLKLAPALQGSQLQVLDMQGRGVYATTVTATEMQIAPNLPAGVYLMRLTNGQTTITQKLVRE
ncbi:MAG TPA: T9SS type A sorting domain-containing protein [Chitinophagales bacterium]|nr:T9SS type A sorting domain-containing protein [Chitinophagales bacterium]